LDAPLPLSVSTGLAVTACDARLGPSAPTFLTPREASVSRVAESAGSRLAVGGVAAEEPNVAGVWVVLAGAWVVLAGAWVVLLLVSACVAPAGALSAAASALASVSALVLTGA
jgi:hypothetical protein